MLGGITWVHIMLLLVILLWSLIVFHWQMMWYVSTRIVFVIVTAKLRFFNFAKIFRGTLWHIILAWFKYESSILKLLTICWCSWEFTWFRRRHRGLSSYIFLAGAIRSAICKRIIWLGIMKDLWILLLDLIMTC